MPVQTGLPIKTALALILGVGFAAANTVANMFIVEVRPKEEWDARIGALQAFSGFGQVVGLLLAGLIGGRFALAFGIAAALVAAAVPIAWLTLRGVQVAVPRTAVAAHPPLGGEGWVGAPQRQSHLPTWSGLCTLRRELERPFVHLLIVWFVAFVAISAVLTMFPLAFIREFSTSQKVPATTYAFAAAGSLGIYSMAATLAKARGRAARAAGGFCGAHHRHRGSGRCLCLANGWRAAGTGRVYHSRPGLAAIGCQRYGARCGTGARRKG